MTVQQINEAISALSSEDRGKVTDGYHKFSELYEHRIANYMALLKTIFDRDCSLRRPWYIWKSKAHSDGSVWDGWFILGIYTNPGEQITYHLPISKWDECSFARVLDKAPEWDGHTSADVIQRLNSLKHDGSDTFMTLFFQPQSDGKFKVILPQSDVYYVRDTIEDCEEIFFDKLKEGLHRTDIESNGVTIRVYKSR